MPRRIEDYRGLTQFSRVRLLHAVQRRPGRRLRELATLTQLHVNTARDHLRVLEDEGLIISAPEATGTRGRPPTVYSPVTNVNENPAARKRAEQAQELGDKLRKFAPDLAHATGLSDDAQHQIDTLYTHLEDVGMEPELDEEDLTINLDPCPFGSMIESERSVVCSVHATLVQHHLAQVPGPLSLHQLRPFVTPEVCQVALRMKRGSDSLAEKGPAPACASATAADAETDTDTGTEAGAETGTGPSTETEGLAIPPPVERAAFPPNPH